MAHTAAAPRALLAGGGTGGHVFPALAVGDELARRGWRVSFTGLAHGMEARLVGERGGDFHPLPARPLLGKGAGAKVRGMATLARSAVAARGLVRRLDARVVVGTGGYVSVPAVVGARLARRPALLLEPNARAGAANRWLSRLASEAALAYAVTAGEMACPTTVTGVPVREAFFQVPAMEPGDTLRLLVVGGSQGARQLNELMPRALARLAGRLPAPAVRHQCGAAHVEATRSAYAAAGLAGEVEVIPFIDEMAAAMAAADLLVCRAGALTVAEICAAGRPALLVPLGIAGGHQEANGRVLTAAGAGRMLLSTQATPEAAADVLAELLATPEELAAMGRTARGLARPGAVGHIADRVEALAAGSRARAAGRGER